MKQKLCSDWYEVMLHWRYAVHYRQPTQSLLFSDRYIERLKEENGFKWPFTDPDACFFFSSTVHLFSPLQFSDQAIHCTIFSKIRPLHKGIHHLDHLCPYNSVEKVNIRKVILVPGCFSAVVCCCCETAGVTNQSQCNGILPQVLYGGI